MCTIILSIITGVTAFFTSRFFFWRKRIEFFSLLPGIEKVHPITRAVNYRPQWYINAGNAYKEKEKTCPFKYNRTITKCAGIRYLFNLGYIVYNHVDVAVEVKELEDLSVEFNFTMPFNQEEVPPYTLGKYMEVMDPKVLTNFTPPVANASKYILKFNTPWRIKAPYDTVFLETPVMYSDEKKFMACLGIFDPYLSRKIHPQCWWFGKPGTTEVIKAGTPLAQYIPIKRSEINGAIEHIIRDPTKFDHIAEKSVSMLFEHTVLSPSFKHKKETAYRIYSELDKRK